MAFTIIEGKYHVVGYSPDGDSVRFEANNSNNWGLLSGRVKVNGRGHAQLRLEAIDTLETHFKDVNQPLGLAQAAMDHLMASLGISNIQWNASNTRVVNANDGVPGYIISRTAEKNGRPVAFAFVGGPPKPDGNSVFLDSQLVEKSINAEMLKSGFAYPTYYKGLFSDLRNALTKIAKEARVNNLGVWKEDVTNTGFTINNFSDLTNDFVILPKLFRRLVDYLEGGNDVSGFRSFLASNPEEILVISNSHLTHFDSVIRANGNTVHMTEQPENLMFM